LGGAYYNGWGVPQDDAKAATWFRKAAEQGHAEAQFGLGAIYAHTDYTQAASWYRKAAEQGHADSQRCLGEFYVCGWGVEMDYAQAAFWMRKMVEQAVETEERLSVILSVDDYWLRTAAEQGIVNAQYLLGWLYHHGRHVRQDHAQAAKWYRMAAEQGDTEAKCKLRLL
jgi:TPR repeat protein